MSSLPVGINYEGGKISEYAELCPLCLAYINAQIAMDAPFHNEVADENVRNSGRSEKSMAGYVESRMLSEIDSLVKIIKTFLVATAADQEPEPLTIIQVARGRSATETISLITPLLEANFLSRYIVATGYKSASYFQYPDEPFVLLNIGMFGRLTCVESIAPGTVLNPTHTFDVIPCTSAVLDSRSLELKLTVARTHSNSKNLLHNSVFPPLILLGIDDSMPFVTPAAYEKDEIYKLVNTVVAAL